MRKWMAFLFFIPFISEAQVSQPLNICSQDQTVSNYPYQLQVTPTSALLDNGNGTMLLTVGGGAVSGSTFTTILVTSNTILSGTTFYQNGPQLISGPAVIGNQISGIPPITSMLDVRLTSNTFTDPHGGVVWASRIVSGALGSPTGGLEVVADRSGSISSPAFTVGDPFGDKFFEIDSAGDFSITSLAYIVSAGGGYGLPSYLEYENNSGYGSAAAELRALGTASPFVFGIDGNGSDNNAYINQKNSAPMTFLTNNTQAMQITASGAVQITSNTILSGATFYQNGPVVISTATYLNTPIVGATQLYRCSGGTAANLIMYGPTGAEQTVCTTGGGTVVAEGVYFP
jgi:hypothetical protein